MAEFCVDCWNELNGTNDPPENFVVSKELDLCEGCAQMKHVVIAIKPSGGSFLGLLRSLLGLGRR